MYSFALRALVRRLFRRLGELLLRRVLFGGELRLALLDLVVEAWTMIFAEKQLTSLSAAGAATVLVVVVRKRRAAHVHAVGALSGAAIVSAL